MPVDLLASGLVVVAGGRRIVDRASLAIGGGEVVTIEGPSGSGKTTFLRAIARLTPVTSGTITLDSADALAMSPRLYRRRVACVPQLPVMLDGTIADNISAGPALRGERVPDDVIAQLLDDVGIDRDRHAEPARDLSGGERQRVALARAIANGPDVLVLDEPTSALDPASAEKMFAHVVALADRGLAIAIVTHDRDHAAAIGGRRVRVDRGRLEEVPT